MKFNIDILDFCVYEKPHARSQSPPLFQKLSHRESWVTWHHEGYFFGGSNETIIFRFVRKPVVGSR